MESVDNVFLNQYLELERVDNSKIFKDIVLSDIHDLI